MTTFQVYVTLAVFSAVILAIAFELVDMVLAALLGVATLIVAGVFSSQHVTNIAQTAGGPIALLFGGMVVARVLAPTGVFDWVGTHYLRLTRGSGKRFLLGLILLVAPLCMVLPNATTVVLLAPIIIRVARQLEVDFVGPLVIAAIISNSAGLLTLVGDPATFLVGSSIGMSFGQYLQKVSLGGLLAVLVLVPLLPVLQPEVWRVRRELPVELPAQRIERPLFASVAVLVLLAMVLLFLIGDQFRRTRASGRGNRRRGAGAVGRAGGACGVGRQGAAGRRLEDAVVYRPALHPRGRVQPDRGAAEPVRHPPRLAWHAAIGRGAGAAVRRRRLPRRWLPTSRSSPRCCSS